MCKHVVGLLSITGFVALPDVGVIMKPPEKQLLGRGVNVDRHPRQNGGVSAIAPDDVSVPVTKKRVVSVNQGEELWRTLRPIASEKHVVFSHKAGLTAFILGEPVFQGLYFGMNSHGSIIQMHVQCLGLIAVRPPKRRPD